MKKSPLWKQCEKVVFEHFNNDFGKNSVAYRFTDSADINRQSYKKGVRFVVTEVTNPSDFIVTCNGVTFFAEVKCTSDEKGVKPTLLKQQGGSRRRITAAGGEFLYFIYSAHHKEWYKVHASDFIDKNKTVTWDELKNCIYTRLKGKLK